MNAKTTDQTIPLRDRCLNHFATLRIPVEATALDELLTRAEKEGCSHLSFLDRLLGAEAGARRERAVARRIREASFAESKTLEGFDWNFNPRTFDRVQMEELATGDFIRRRTNLIMVGWSGIGKSHIMQALGQKACVYGYRVLYRTSAQLLADLTASLADKTLPARLRRYANPDFLIIDEFGFDKIERAECPEAATCSIRSSLHAIRSAPRHWLPMWTSTNGETTSPMVRWRWPSSTVWSRERSFSRSKASPTAPKRRKRRKAIPHKSETILVPPHCGGEWPSRNPQLAPFSLPKWPLFPLPPSRGAEGRD